jgi:ABC-type dipeptide/oligopeptide/nickel transport system permease component
MARYVLIRIFLMVPVFFALATGVFFISDLAPGDRVRDYLDIFGSVSTGSRQVSIADHEKTARLLDLDKPKFYFSIHPAAYPDTLHRIVNENENRLARIFVSNSIPWEITEDIIRKLNQLGKTIESQRPHNPGMALSLWPQYQKMIRSKDRTDFESEFASFVTDMTDTNSTVEIKHQIGSLSKIISSAFNTPYPVASFRPQFSWHGLNNRFNIWFGKVLKFDFGLSSIDGRKVSVKIGEAFPLTLTYVIMAYLFSFIIAIPLGIASSYYRKGKFVRMLVIFMSGFYSVPLFWLSTLAVIFLTTSEVTGLLHIFPPIGVGFLSPEEPFTARMMKIIPRLLLPALVVAVHSGAYLSMLIKRNLDNEMSESYFISLLSRGISKRKAVLAHAFPNSLLPLITIFTMSFPAAVAGSVIIEVIFNLPGMGRLMYDSILRYDWNIVFAIVLLIGMLTYLFYLAGDLLYQYFNPKIRY